MQPNLPDYSNRCVDAVLRLSGAGRARSAADFGHPGAGRLVLLVVDGLGYDALRTRQAIAPHLNKHLVGSVTSVVPTTTAAALTSLTTGTPPGLHGIVGQRLPVRGPNGWCEFDVLRWHWAARCGQAPEPPGRLDSVPFPAGRPWVVSKLKHLGTGFTRLHLGADPDGAWKMPSGIAVEVRRALRHGAGDVYVYYDGLDTTAHHYGYGAHYDAELAYVETLFTALADLLGPGVSLVVTSDHGTVPITRDLVLPVEVTDRAAAVGGEDRNVYLIARDGDEAGLIADTKAALADVAWVYGADEIVDGGLLGPRVLPAARARLGTVRVYPHAGFGFRLGAGPSPEGPRHSVCGHGSLTADEMNSPLVVLEGAA